MRIELLLLAASSLALGAPCAMAEARPAGSSTPAAPAPEIRTDFLTQWRTDRLPRRALPGVRSQSRAVSAERRAAPAADHSFVPTDVPSPSGAAVEQVVVTSDALAAAFQRFADEETRRGTLTVVRTTSWIDARYSGPDQPARIRTFLRDAHDLWGTQWVVLGGDVEHVPVRYVPWGTEQIPTDLYYQCLDREWNEDGDAIYGEPIASAAYDGYLNGVAVGPDGRSWVATYFGVAAFDGARFTSWGAADGLPSEQVLCVDVAPDGSAWAGTSDGVARWDGASWRAWGTPDGVPGVNVLCVDAASADDAWIGTNDGLAHWDGTRWRSWRAADGLPNGLVTSLARDGSALWIGTPGGAARFDGTTFTRYDAATSGILSNWVISVAVDPRGRVWLGHADNWFSRGGVSVLDGGVWTKDPLSAWSGMSVRGFAFTNRGDDVWAATSRGLFHRGPAGDALLGTSDGLAADDLYDVALRGDGTLDVATSAGLTRGVAGAWTVHGVAEGLPAAPRDYDDIDLLPDLVLGRIPASDEAELDGYLDKLDAYRRGDGCDHADRVLLLGQDMEQPGDGKAVCQQEQALFPPSFACTGLYQVDGTEGRAAVIAGLNAGPAWVVNVSHGSYDVIGVGPGMELLFNHDIDATSSGGRAAFVMLYSCNVGAFDFESAAEHFLFHPAGGAVATVANTREAAPPLDAELNGKVLTEIFGAAQGRPAVALRNMVEQELASRGTDLRTATWWRRAVLSHSFLGAPTLALWRKVPAALAVDVPASAPLARAPFAVKVRDAATGQPVPGALVCVSKGVEDWTRAAADADGRVALDFRPATAGRVDVVVSAPDYREWTGSVPVAAPAGPNPVAESADAAVTRTGADGRDVDLRLSMQNTGSAAPSAWSVTLASDDAGVVVVSGSGSLAALGAGETGWAGPFHVHLRPDLPDGAPFSVRLQGTGSSTFSETFRATLHAPALALAALHVDGGVVAPVLTNVGGLPTGPLTATLTATNPSGTVTDGAASTGALAPGQSVELGDGFRASGPSSARFELRVSDGAGTSLVRTIDLDRPAAPSLAAAEPRDAGAVLTWQPSSAADLSGYRVLRRADGSWVDDRHGALVRGARVEVTLPAGASCDFAIVAVDSSGLDSADSLRVTAHAAPVTLAGWPRKLSSLIGPSPIVAADLDGDGRREILFGSMWQANAVNVFRADGVQWTDGDLDPATAGPFGVTGGRVHAAPLAVDVDGDGTKEIFAVSFDGYAYGWRLATTPSGTPVPLPGWPVFLAAQGARSGPVAADVDGDGKPEIVTVALDGRVRVLHADGTMAPGWPKVTRAFGTGSTPAVSDLDGDGRDDLVFGGTDSLLYAVSGTGADLPGWPRPLGAQVLSSPVLADVNGDGSLEIFAMARDGKIWGFRSYDRDGVPGADPLPGWPVSFEPYTHTPPSPAVCDFDGDGVPEIVVPGATSLAVLRANGTFFPGWPKSLGAEIVNSPVVADLDGDGRPDILIGTDDRKLRALRIDGSSVTGWPRSFNETPWCTPFVADVDGDGTLDVALASDDLDVRVVTTGVADRPGAAPWPGYHGGASLSGVYQAPPGASAVAAPAALSAAPLALELAPAAPNPFRAATSLRFVVPKPGRTRLDVFDVAGRRVATPVDAVLPAGAHSVTWDGRDVTGRPASSGVYFLRLATPEGSRTARVIRLR
ncbi:MAG: C25 family cysteine peptidase [bacterium]